LVLSIVLPLKSSLATTNALAGTPMPTSTSALTPGINPAENNQSTAVPTISFNQIDTPLIYLPFVQYSNPIHAMRIDYPDYANSRDLVDTLEQQMQAVGINMVALGAGRVEWTYFKWSGHEDSWSNDVKDTGIDFLYEDSTRFGRWAHTDAVVDVFAPNYILAHPDKAAISVDGIPSENLVSFTELVHGEFGQRLLDMIDYIAANYPVDSISITELYYHRDGYGPDDKAAYMAYSGNADWPRSWDGTIDTFDPSIGNWRSHELDIFLDRAVQLAHNHGKQLFMDVELSLENLNFMTNEHGTNYNLVLEHMDRIVVWGYFGVDHYAPEYLREVAQFLTQFSQNRLILSIGLWNDNGEAISADSLRTAMQSAQAGGIKNIWITPSLLMGDAHWQVLRDFWGHPAP
jgi:hypothetical protein